MNPDNPKSAAHSDRDLQQKAVQQATRRMIWKFTAILVCLVAYIFLHKIENAKESYDKAQARPIVIVSNQYVKDNANKSDNDNAEKTAENVGSTKCASLSSGSREEPDRNYKARLLPICALEGLFEPKSDVFLIIERKLMYQNFSDDDAIIDRLDEEILAEANAEKRALNATEEVENRARARKLPDLSEEETWIHQALKQHGFNSLLPEQASPEEKETELERWIQNRWENLKGSERYAREAEIGNWRNTLAQMRYSNTTSLKSPELLVLHHVILEERSDDTRRTPLTQETEKIDKKAQLQLTAVYERLKPRLSKLIDGSPGALKDYEKTKLGLFSFDPRPVLDAKNGIHLVYQIIRLALMMVLGLGLIFLIVFLIRLIPPISRGTDQFAERAGEFFKRSEGGGPQLAKSLLMAVSAVGIGAAVAVGSTVVGLTAVAGDSRYVANHDERNGQNGGKKGRNGSDGDRERRGEDGSQGPAGEPGPQVDLHQVKLLEPIVYPSPITVSGPTSVTLSGDSLTTITNAITKFQSNDLDLRITDIVKTEIEKSKVNKSVKPNDCCSTDLAPLIQALESWQKNYSQTSMANLDALAKDLRATKEAVEKLQAENLERVQNSGGRGFVTSGKQLFKGDRYLVTPRSVEALALLMRKPAHDCDPTATTKCCDNKPTDKSYCPSTVVEAILKQLSNMVAEPPQTESDFMKQLRMIRGGKGDAVDKAIDQWKSTILKYTRIAY